MNNIFTVFEVLTLFGDLVVCVIGLLFLGTLCCVVLCYDKMLIETKMKFPRYTRESISILMVLALILAPFYILHKFGSFLLSMSAFYVLLFSGLALVKLKK